MNEVKLKTVILYFTIAKVCVISYVILSPIVYGRNSGSQCKNISTELVLQIGAE